MSRWGVALSGDSSASPPPLDCANRLANWVKTGRKTSLKALSSGWLGRGARYSALPITAAPRSRLTTPVRQISRMVYSRMKAMKLSMRGVSPVSWMTIESCP